VGRPVPVEDWPQPADGPVIVVARDRVGFRQTIERVQRWQAAGVDVRGVLLAGDEAVLVGARVTKTIPVLDSVDPDAALRCRVVAMEVAAPGAPLATLTDPIRLAHDLGLGEDEIEHAQAAAGELRGHRSAAIGALVIQPASIELDAGIQAVLSSGIRVALPALRPLLQDSPVGLVRQLQIPGRVPETLDDAWLIELAAVDALPGLRAGDVRTRDVVIAALAGEAGQDDPRAAFTDEWLRVDVVATEATASRLGGLSTPGAPGDTWVIDLGGGTLDAVDPTGRAVVAAGCGDLLTMATARTLGISTGAAEWVKRGPASHVDAPHVVMDESGERRFLDDAAPMGTVGWLVANGPSGLLPFSRRLEVAQWRTIRLALKQRAIADNLHRILATFEGPPAHALVQGGPAGDSELLQTLNSAFSGTVVGRADVAGRLGHRWAVAYGLVLAAIGADST
jgi:hypothetical protein